MIRNIEKLSPELRVELLGNLHVLEDREIKIAISRSDDNVSSSVAEGQRLVVNEGGRVEPLLDGMRAGVGIPSAKPSGPACLRKLLGKDYFADVTYAYLHGIEVTDAGLEHL